MHRFPIRFDPPWALLFRALFMPPSQAFLEVDEARVRVRMSFGFAASFPRACVASVRPLGTWVLSIGVHGMAGRWLVNGSHRGITVLELRPEQRARVLGFPVRLRQLMVSVEDPEALVRALAGCAGVAPP